jgi:hypothetical protein
MLKSTGQSSERRQLRASAAASDTDPYKLEKLRLNEENSSGSLLPIVSMMQAAAAREGNQTRGLMRLGRNRSPRRCVFLQRVVDSVRVIIRDVILDQTAQMNVVEDNQVIEKLSATASDPAFRHSILPRACRANACGSHAAGW